jgi:outer membrane protein assembly factor BamB
MTHDTPDVAKPSAKRRERLWPPKWLCLVTACLLALILFVRIADPLEDHAIANILTLVLSFICFCWLSVWFTFASDYGRTLRMAWPVAVVLALSVFLALYKIVGVDGELVPVFGSRWGQPADGEIGEFKAATPEPTRVMRVGEGDFSQFLGPNRNATVKAPTLDRDWRANKPEELWRIKIGAGWSPFVVGGDLAVTLEQRGETEAVTCYSLDSGELVWSHKAKKRHATILGGAGPRSAATLFAGKVFALGASGDLYCLDGGTGKLHWDFNVLDHYQVSVEDDIERVAWGRSGSPLIVDDLVVIPAGGGLGEGQQVSLIALNQATGAVVWESGDELNSYSSPVLVRIAGMSQIVSVNEATVSGHHPQTGRLLWTHPWDGKSNAAANCSQPQLVGENQVFLSKGYGQGCQLIELTMLGSEEWGVKVVWENRRALRTKFTNVAIRNGFAYGLCDGILECVDLSDGTSQWRRGRYRHGQVLMVDDVLLVQAELGEIFLVDARPDKLVELAKLEALTSQTWNNPCLAGDKLLVRNAQEAACYRLPLKYPLTLPADKASE